MCSGYVTRLRLVREKDSPLRERFFSNAEFKLLAVEDEKIIIITALQTLPLPHSFDLLYLHTGAWLVSIILWCHKHDSCYSPPPQFTFDVFALFAYWKLIVFLYIFCDVINKIHALPIPHNLHLFCLHTGAWLVFIFCDVITKINALTLPQSLHLLHLRYLHTGTWLAFIFCDKIYKINKIIKPWFIIKSWAWVV